MILGEPTRARDVLRFIDYFAAGPATWIEPFVDALRLERAERNTAIAERNDAIRQRDQYRQLTYSQTWSRLSAAEDAVRALAGVTELKAELARERTRRQEVERQLATVLRPQFEPAMPVDPPRLPEHGETRVMWATYVVPEYLRRHALDGEHVRGEWKILQPPDEP